MKKSLWIAVVVSLVFSVGSAVNAATNEEILGELLYFDANLSNPPGQSCATCHLPRAGFADPDKSTAVSAGVVRGKFGTRCTPSAAYAAFSPPFHFDEAEGLYIGGQFWDGRAVTLEDQAKGPFLNPGEMNNTKEGVVKAILKSDYANLFRKVYGFNSLSLKKVETAYDLAAKAIAAFERSASVNSFSSKYDYFLKGKVSLTERETRGLGLFNSPAKGNCAACHPSTSTDGVTQPLFTDFSYDNLGIPKNLQIEELNGGPLPPDLGLGAIVGANENGKFKVPTMRNLARTAPYGHNGYFKTLREIVHFYNTKDVPGAGWPPPEVQENVNKEELGNLGLTSEEEDDIVAFLLTLTDGFFCAQCQ